MTKYQIKGEYISGCHAGKWFILEKGGRVHFNPNGYKFPFNCYMTESAAKGICTKLAKTDKNIKYSVIIVE